MNLLFVCSSNVCRSPYCEYMFRRMAEEDPVTAGKIHVSGKDLRRRKPMLIIQVSGIGISLSSARLIPSLG